ncbi:hypothetical protein [Methanobacterium oryzae]|uniref:hypothetical protein n=1 Tax=Methanobacterium oryzae TaxID=69540 RepID=UPI003D1A211A
MEKISIQEYQKLISILEANKHLLSESIEEKAADILKSIVLEAKDKKCNVSKAKINLINTSQGPEIAVNFEE